MKNLKEFTVRSFWGCSLMNTLYGIIILNTVRRKYPEEYMQSICQNTCYHKDIWKHYIIAWCIHTYSGIRLWGNTYQKHIKKLESVQKRAVRAIMGAKYNDPSTPLFKILNILKLKDLYELQTMHFVYDFVNLFLPGPLLNVYTYDQKQTMVLSVSDMMEIYTDIIPVMALILNLQKELWNNAKKLYVHWPNPMVVSG